MTTRSKPPASSGSQGHGVASVGPGEVRPQAKGPTAPKPWIIYCRVSTEEQANEGASMAAQENALSRLLRTAQSDRG